MKGRILNVISRKDGRIDSMIITTIAGNKISAADVILIDSPI